MRALFEHKRLEQQRHHPEPSGAVSSSDPFMLLPSLGTSASLSSSLPLQHMMLSSLRNEQIINNTLLPPISSILSSSTPPLITSPGGSPFFPTLSPFASGTLSPYHGSPSATLERLQQWHGLLSSQLTSNFNPTLLSETPSPPSIWKASPLESEVKGSGSDTGSGGGSGSSSKANSPPPTSSPSINLKTNASATTTANNLVMHNIYSSRKKPRIRWTNQLHSLFLEAKRELEQANLKVAPGSILRVLLSKMKEDPSLRTVELSREHVASHLQKYRGESDDLKSPSRTNSEPTRPNNTPGALPLLAAAIESLHPSLSSSTSSSTSSSASSSVSSPTPSSPERSSSLPSSPSKQSKHKSTKHRHQATKHFGPYPIPEKEHPTPSAISTPKGQCSKHIGKTCECHHFPGFSPFLELPSISPPTPTATTTTPLPSPLSPKMPLTSPVDSPTPSPAVRLSGPKSAFTSLGS